MKATIPIPHATAPPIQEGDVVQVRDPDVFSQTFSNKVRGRNATVLWVGIFEGRTALSVKLRFHRRGAHGGEFVETLQASDVARVTANSEWRSA